MRDWLESLRTAPSRMTRAERAAVMITATIVIATRFLAVSRSIWDWDEALFLLGMRDYDVAQHHPHPPGFPVFIAAAKLARLVATSDFRALQGVTLLASILLFPAMWLLARELRLNAATAIVAATLLPFFPNVWLYGGTALSDVPALMLSISASALLLRGVRSCPAAAGGALLAAAAMGVRPQTVLVIALPMLVLLLIRWRRGLAVVFTTLMLTIGSYAIAAGMTGVDEYRRAVAAHAAYIAATDTFRSAGRPSLLRLIDDFWIRPFRQPALNLLIAALGLAGLARAVIQRHVPALVAMSLFLPLAVAAWLLLDPNSVGRFSVGYMPLLVFAAAEGATMSGRRTTPVVTLVVVMISAAWMLPALKEVREHPSPPVVALARAAGGGPAVTLNVDRRLGAFVAALHSQHPFLEVTPGVRAAAWTDGDSMAVIEGQVAGAQLFSRKRNALWNVARRRYFDVSVIEPQGRVVFLAGWFSQEGNGAAARRWATRTSTLQLPPVARNGQLTVSLLTVAPEQVVEIDVDGEARVRGRASGGYFDRTLTISSRGKPVVVTIHTDRVVTVRGDSRELAVRLEALGWIAR